MTKNLLEEYDEVKKSAINLLKILNIIPFNYINDINDFKIIKNTKIILYNFLSLNFISENEINNVKQIIGIFDFNTLFENNISEMEKAFCNREINKYINNPTTYKIPNLESYIDNGYFLREYIFYKINGISKESIEEKIIKKSKKH